MFKQDATQNYLKEQTKANVKDQIQIKKWWLLIVCNSNWKISMIIMVDYGVKQKTIDRRLGRLKTTVFQLGLHRSGWALYTLLQGLQRLDVQSKLSLPSLIFWDKWRDLRGRHYLSLDNLLSAWQWWVGFVSQSDAFDLLECFNGLMLKLRRRDDC